MRVPLHNDGDVLIVVDEYTKLSSVSMYTFPLFRLTLRQYKFLPAETSKQKLPRDKLLRNKKQR